MIWSIPCLLASSLLVLAAAAHADVQKYLGDREGKPELKATLTLQEEQGGIAGINVYRWTIKPSGEWTYAEYQLVGGKERPGSREEKTGKLTGRELRTLTRDLASQDL